MTHTGAEMDGHVGGARLVEFGRPRVLVLAYPELARAVQAALEPGPAPGEGAGVRVYTEARSLEELCARIFPPRPAQETQTDDGLLGSLGAGLSLALETLRRVMSPRTRPPEADAEAAPAPPPASLFEWGDYDFVIIQDFWASRGAAGGETLEAAGYELALLDYYVRGNFNTKKIILITDEEFLLEKAGEERDWRAEGLERLVTAAFDQKNAIALVRLNSPDAGARLRALVGRPQAAGEGAALPDAGNPVAVPLLRERVGDAFAEALRRYIKTRAEVIVVDDERQELEKTFRQVTGGAPPRPDPAAAAGRGVIVASELALSSAESFDGLVRLCEQRYEQALEGGKDYVLFVTDILFKIPTWEETGIDLIEELRRRRLARRGASRRYGIVAFTGFTTPFIAMSAYQRGADFVVPKVATGSHDLFTVETDYLLMTLASLCFQKSFLHDKRREARRLMGAAGPESFSRTLRQLRAVLPRHAISLHLQQEWLDTCYILEALPLYEPGGEQAQHVFREVSDKYD